MGTEIGGGRISTSRELPIAIGGFYLQPRSPMQPETDCNGEITAFLAPSFSPFFLAIRLSTFTFGHTSPGKSFTNACLRLFLSFSNRPIKVPEKWLVQVTPTGIIYTVSPIPSVPFCLASFGQIVTIGVRSVIRKDRCKHRFFAPVETWLR